MHPRTVKTAEHCISRKHSYECVEDKRYAVDCLVTLPFVDEGYYCMARNWHPRADNIYLQHNQVTKMAFPAIENIYLLTQTVLPVVGDTADSECQME